MPDIPAVHDAAGIPALAIGSETWPGLFKLAEECAEVIQCVARLGAFPSGVRPDGTQLVQALQDELGDLLAAVDLVVGVNNGLSAQAVDERRMLKAERFYGWHWDGRDV